MTRFRSSGQTTLLRGSLKTYWTIWKRRGRIGISVWTEFGGFLVWGIWKSCSEGVWDRIRVMPRSYRLAESRPIGFSPFQLLYGYQPRSAIQNLVLLTTTTTASDAVSDLGWANLGQLAFHNSSYSMYIRGT